MKKALPVQRSGLHVKAALLAAVLVGLTILLFWRVTEFEFTNYDDPDYVANNPIVQQGLTVKGISWAFTQAYSFNWHPVTWMSHMLDCNLFGPKPGAHHFVNVLFHAANTLLLFLLFQRMTGALWRSALVAALFAVHPLHVESVAWVCERKDVLSTFFWLLTTLCYLRYVQLRRSSIGQSSILHRPSSFYILSLVFFALGLMSKPMLVTLPFTLLLVDLWPLQRFALTRDKLKLIPVMEKLPFFGLSIAASIATFFVQRTQGAVADMQSFAPSLRVANALISYVRYLGKTFWPTDLIVFYPYPETWPAARVAGAAFILVLFSAIVLFACRKRPFLLVGWCWFLGTLVPVIGLVQVGLQSIADRYMYVPLIGLAVIVAWSLGEIAQAAPRLRQGAIAIGVVLVGACTVLTNVQLGVWKNSITLFQHALAILPNHTVAHVNIGNAFNDRGDVENAMLHYKEVLRYRPKFAEVHYNLANLYMGQQKLDDAIAEYEKALENRPEYLEAHANLAVAFGRKQRFEDAMRHYEAALKINPNEPDLLRNYAMDLITLRQFDRATDLLNRALQARPDDAIAFMFLGDAAAGQGRNGDAAASYERALQIQPGLEDARRKLGRLRVR